ncbi:hypothetical protein OY671_005403, partial [Metschnikowia pulcherrima]
MPRLSVDARPGRSQAFVRLAGVNAAARTSSAARSVADPARSPSTPPGGTDQPDAEAADVMPSRPVLVPEPTTSDLVEEAVARWRAGLVELAGGSSLADVSLLGDAVVDLTAAHPSGVAQLFAGRPTRLSNLFREGGSSPAARRRARAVVVRAAEHAQRYGVAPTYLAIGVATWTQSPTAPLAEDDVAALARVAGRAPTVVPADGDASGPADVEPAASA